MAGAPLAAQRCPEPENFGAVGKESGDFLSDIGSAKWDE